MANYAAFSESDGERISRAVTRVEGTPQQARMRRRRSSPGGPCVCLNVIELALHGEPTGGTISLDWTLDPDGESQATETITLNFDDETTDVSTAIQVHSLVNSGDFKVRGGPFPSTAIYLISQSGGQYSGAKLEENIWLPYLNTNSLTGGSSPHIVITQKTCFNWNNV